MSTYNVVPDKAAYYFNKIQCFCFEEQRLRPGEVVDMPVFFYIDPELVEDFNCRCEAPCIYVTPFRLQLLVQSARDNW